VVHPKFQKRYASFRRRRSMPRGATLANIYKNLYLLPLSLSLSLSLSNLSLPRPNWLDVGALLACNGSSSRDTREKQWPRRAAVAECTAAWCVLCACLPVAGAGALPSATMRSPTAVNTGSTHHSRGALMATHVAAPSRSPATATPESESSQTQSSCTTQMGRMRDDVAWRGARPPLVAPPPPPHPVALVARGPEQEERRDEHPCRRFRAEERKEGAGPRSTCSRGRRSRSRRAGEQQLLLSP
jgi:hypothetical protein